MKPFPVEVEMLSRFRSKKEQGDVLTKLAAGRVDVVIGTHRLLQKDVQFKDLGLLVVDEEQRFGVAHKEWLKQKRREVDVLTLTATPIPRTLYMSLAGARDMSTIDTPPEDRLPIKTYVGEYDESLIRRALIRELNRGGQVFFVHNRVQGIQQIAQRVRKLVPEATIGVGHGQMPEADLEKVMLDFANGRLDVLVCTSIIESGLDIPNANTMIINRADRFGLAQLYQLRGRVGRSTERAYAYLLYPRHQPLTLIARKRLDTIMEASELGAGFRIAMRDLEIRGAGELLGARQHGHIAAVGFDLYCRLLAQAVREIKGESPPKVLDETALYLRPLQTTAQLNLPLQAFLPESYVTDANVRLQLYRRLAAANLEEIALLEQELVDRFGAIPPEADNLLFLMRVKALATQCDARAVGQESDQIVVRAPWLFQMDRSFGGSLPNGARLGRGQVWITLDGAWRETLEKTLQAMNEAYLATVSG
jgi:transcription-repair coupling factor (superfamily II helicase)